MLEEVVWFVNHICTITAETDSERIYIRPLTTTRRVIFMSQTSVLSTEQVRDSIWRLPHHIKSPKH